MTRFSHDYLLCSHGRTVQFLFGQFYAEITWLFGDQCKQNAPSTRGRNEILRSGN
ncbi:protein of unknown function [Acidithiobacillus ferrivorans]|uniref:Uncharacterized protein n=1 Tax=Acidithiobacillus ferrivorans TaxID=160808 RepID=A0ABY1MLT5_9PROT|nr:protein of unknown function [Acidithiobacillus ferrivorans]